MSLCYGVKMEGEEYFNFFSVMFWIINSYIKHILKCLKYNSTYFFGLGCKHWYLSFKGKDDFSYLSYFLL